MSHSRVFNGNSTIQRKGVITTLGTGPAYSLKLSPGGDFLAIGNDSGMLEIRMYETARWRRVGVYETGASIRAIVWHPSQRATVFCGSANGCIHRITVVLRGTDVVRDARINGFIHFLQLNSDGRKLAIGHGRSVSIVNDPFTEPNGIGTLTRIPLRLVDNVRDISDYQIPRGIYFLSEHVILVAFFGKHGIVTISMDDFSFLWLLHPRNATLVGSVAVSPSGERLAVMNLVDGIDFYSTSHRCLLSTVHYNLSTSTPLRNAVVDIVFVDEDTVAFGHSDGYVALATFGIPTVSGTFTIEDVHTPIQTIAFGYIQRLPHIFALVPFSESVRSRDRYTSDIHIGLIVTDTSTGAHATAPRDSSTAAIPIDIDTDEDPGWQFTSVQLIIMIIVTIVATAYGQHRLFGGRSKPVAEVRPSIPLATVTPLQLLPTVLVESQSPDDRDSADRLCAFTLTGTVTGSVSLPTKGFNRN